MLLRRAGFALLAGFAILFFSVAGRAGQQQPPSQRVPSQQSAAAPQPQLPTTIQEQAANASSPKPSRLRIGPGDEADVTVFGLPELGQHVRVSGVGEISLPFIGTIHVAGLTSDEAQALIEKKLVDGNFLKNPHVAFYVKDYISDGVTVLGEVAHPGTYSILTARRVFDAFLAA